jgi:small neutral amino acid transporter SnatA (MarC family)
MIQTIGEFIFWTLMGCLLGAIGLTVLIHRLLPRFMRLLRKTTQTITTRT